MQMKDKPSKVPLNNKAKIYLFLKKMRRWKAKRTTKESLAWLSQLRMRQPNMNLQLTFKASPLLHKVGALR